MAPGVTQVSYQGTVTGTNFATLATDDPATGSVGDATVTPLNVADLSVAKAGLPNPVFAGGTLTYTITVTNAGPQPALNASLVDPSRGYDLPVPGERGWLESARLPRSGGTGAVACTNPSLAVGSSVFALVARVTRVPGGTRS